MFAVTEMTIVASSPQTIVAIVSRGRRSSRSAQVANAARKIASGSPSRAAGPASAPPHDGRSKASAVAPRGSPSASRDVGPTATLQMSTSATNTGTATATGGPGVGEQATRQQHAEGTGEDRLRDDRAAVDAGVAERPGDQRAADREQHRGHERLADADDRQRDGRDGEQADAAGDDHGAVAVADVRQRAGGEGVGQRDRGGR